MSDTEKKGKESTQKLLQESEDKLKAIINQKDEEIKKLMEIVNEYKNKYEFENSLKKELEARIIELESTIQNQFNEIDSLRISHDKKVKDLSNSYDKENGKIILTYEVTIRE